MPSLLLLALLAGRGIKWERRRERGPTTNTRRGGGVRRGRGGKRREDPEATFSGPPPPPPFSSSLLISEVVFHCPPLSPLHMVASFSRNELHIANCCAPLLHFQRASRQIITKIVSTFSFASFLFFLVMKKRKGSRGAPSCSQPDPSDRSRYISLRN